MRLYEGICTKCDLQQEVFAETDENGTIVGATCADCNGKLRNIICAPHARTDSKTGSSGGVCSECAESIMEQRKAVHEEAARRGQSVAGEVFIPHGDGHLSSIQVIGQNPEAN